MVQLYEFQEHALYIQGEKNDLIALAEILREAGAEGTLGDLCYQIEYEFDIDGIKTENEKELNPCDFGECPYNAHGGYDCRNYCGLGVDESETEDDDECPLGGDTTNDCADCAYAGDYHFEDGHCVRRDYI